MILMGPAFPAMNSAVVVMDPQARIAQHVLEPLFKSVLQWWSVCQSARLALGLTAYLSSVNWQSKSTRMHTFINSKKEIQSNFKTGPSI